MRKLILVLLLIAPLLGLKAQSGLDSLSRTEIYSGDNLFVKNNFAKEGEAILALKKSI
jgi:hypothetical protein